MTSNVLPAASAVARAYALVTFAALATSSFSAIAQIGADTTLPMVVTTATRSPQAARDVLSDNVVITSEEIARSGFTSLPDLLQKKRGIEISRTGGPGTAASVFLRGGSNNQTVVLVDGVRSGSSTSGGATWSVIPVSQIERVEIIYGPLSTLYGADAVSGVVQIFTKKGSGAPRLSASAGAGSYATRALAAGISGATAGETAVHYAFNVARERADGFNATKLGNFSFNDDRDGYVKESASGQFGLQLAPGHDLGLNFLQSRLESQFDNGAAPFDANGVGKLGTLALTSTNRILPNWTSQLRLYRSTDKSDSRTSADPVTGLSVFDTTQQGLSWQNDLAIGTDMLQLIAERRIEKIDSTTTALVGRRSTNSAAGSYLLKRGPHLANFSARTDNNSQFGSHATGSAGYGYRIAETLRASASYGTSFRAPTFNELYFPGFGIADNQPEKGKNAELGLYYDDSLTQLNATLYRNDISNLIVNTRPCPVQVAAYPFGCAYNVNKALLTGLTLGAATKLGNFTMRGSLDFQNPEDRTTDKLLVRRAKRHGTLALDYALGPMTAGVETQFSGKRFENAANTVVLAGYGLVNLYGSYALDRDWSVFGRWNNVLDRDYELARNYATPQSDLFVGLQYGFR
ncbi:MAG: TonB-dependent receptor [Pseudomonadota bacterium]